MRGDYLRKKVRDSINKNRKSEPTLYVSAPPINSKSGFTIENYKEMILSYKEGGYDFIKILYLATHFMILY